MYKKIKLFFNVINSKVLSLISFFLLINPKYRYFVTFTSFGEYGRLGNQLFQFAILRSFSLKHNIPILLPDTKKNMLNKFNISCNYVRPYILRSLNKFYFREKQFHYDPKYIEYHNRINFEGYFQSEKYFKEYRKIMINEFSVSDSDLVSYCENYLQDLRIKNNNKPIVALHNRRGDYVPSKKSYSNSDGEVFRTDMYDFHPLLSEDYLKKSRSFFTNSIFLIFSNNQNDIEWCKRNISGSYHFYSEGHDVITDFNLMRLCDHNIISNSSFSWWAAWLNENPQKQIIAPKRWFGKKNGKKSLKDLFPKDWIII